MIDRLKLQAARTATYREGVAIIAAANGNGSYQLVYRGATLSPIWSEGGVRYSVGAVVRVIIEHGRVARIVP